MKKLLSVLMLICLSVFLLAGCDKEKTPTDKESLLKILYIDVGQGDSALIEFEGHYMLIDGGSKTSSMSSNRVYQILVDKKITHLDYLVISHLHEDHYGGLSDALKNVSQIDKTLCNKESVDLPSFDELKKELAICDTKIEVPQEKEMWLGKAKIEVIDNTAKDSNDSLVLLITYGENRFLFTGDIEYAGQKRVCEKLLEDKRTDKNGVFKIDVIKMPHHGAYNSMGGVQDSDLNRLITMTDPSYSVISVGKGYGHPHGKTLEILQQNYGKKYSDKVFRTDLGGDIQAVSNGKTVNVKYCGAVTP